MHCSIQVLKRWSVSLNFLFPVIWAFDSNWFFNRLKFQPSTLRRVEVRSWKLFAMKNLSILALGSPYTTWRWRVDPVSLFDQLKVVCNIRWRLHKILLIEASHWIYHLPIGPPLLLRDIISRLRRCILDRCRWIKLSLAFMLGYHHVNSFLGII
jgi:hypothetical protein